MSQAEKACQETQEISVYAGHGYQIDYFRSQRLTSKLLFTFTGAGNRNLCGTGFGGNFALNCGFDLVAFKSMSDSWYHNLPPAGLRILGEFLSQRSSNYTLRAGYGSSMGGYAAIMLSKWLELDNVFAISPQFNITQAWDTRWSTYVDNLGGPMRVCDGETLRQSCRYVLAYDPYDLDRLHIERFAKIIPRSSLHTFRVLYGGHPVGPVLREAGRLKDVAAAALTGQPVEALAMKRWQVGARHQKYYFGLAAHCMRAEKPRFARAAIERVLKQQPFDCEYNSLASQIAEQQGDIDSALRFAAVAAAVRPDHPHLVANLSRLLHVKKFNAPAMHFIETALALAPALKSFARLRDRIADAVSNQAAGAAS